MHWAGRRPEKKKERKEVRKKERAEVKKGASQGLDGVRKNGMKGHIHKSRTFKPLRHFQGHETRKMAASLRPHSPLYLHVHQHEVPEFGEYADAQTEVPEVGSSRNMIDGAAMMLQAILRRFRSPPDTPRTCRPPGRKPPTYEHTAVIGCQSHTDGLSSTPWP